MAPSEESLSEKVQHSSASSGSSDVSAREEQNRSSRSKEPFPPQALRSQQKAATDSQTKKESQKKPYLADLADQVDVIRKILIAILIFVFSVFLGQLIYAEFKSDVVVIEPLEVPEKLQERGYTGRALANKLTDQISYIREVATTARTSREFLTADAVVPIEVEVAGAGVSLDSLLRSIKESSGRSPTHIVGEVTLPFDDDSLVLTIRATGHPAKTITGTLESLDVTLLEAAEHLYKYTDPFTLASYMYALDRPPDESVEIIQEYCLQRAPSEDDHWADNLWGIILLDEGRYEEAIAKYEEATQLDPRFYLAYRNWGIVLHEQGEYQAAIAKYKKVTELKPDYHPAYDDWGAALHGLEQYEEAIAKYEKAIKIDPGYISAYINWGAALHELGEYEEAIAKYQQAIPSEVTIARYEPATQIKLRFHQAYLNWGAALHELGKYEEAIAKYQRAIAIQPAYALAYLKWGGTLYKQEKYGEAIAKYQKATAIDPEYALAYFNLGVAYRQSGQPDEARKAFEQVLQLDDPELADSARTEIERIEKASPTSQ